MPADEAMFIDRGMPDYLAFCRLCGLNPNEYLVECLHHRYASVFLLDPLEFQLDGMRMETDIDIVDFLAEWHVRDYSALGYNVIRVPVLPSQERLVFVLDNLDEQVRIQPFAPKKRDAIEPGDKQII